MSCDREKSKQGKLTGVTLPPTLFHSLSNTLQRFLSRILSQIVYWISLWIGSLARLSTGFEADDFRVQMGDAPVRVRTASTRLVVRAVPPTFARLC